MVYSQASPEPPVLSEPVTPRESLEEAKARIPETLLERPADDQYGGEKYRSKKEEEQADQEQDPWEAVFAGRLLGRFCNGFGVEFAIQE